MIPNVLAVPKLPVSSANSAPSDVSQEPTPVSSKDATDQTFALILGQHVALLNDADEIDIGMKDRPLAAADPDLLIQADATAAAPAIIAASAFFAAQPVAIAEMAKGTAGQREHSFTPESPSSAVPTSIVPTTGSDASVSMTTDEVAGDRPSMQALPPAPSIRPIEQETLPLDTDQRVAPTLAPASDPAAHQTGVGSVISATQRAEPVTQHIQVEPPVGGAGWKESFTNKVAWVVHQGRQVADLQLNPPHLGPVEVRVVIGSDQASIAFSSSHAVVREAIQAALPRLSEILQGQGVQLSDVSIAAQSFGQQQSRGEEARQQRDELRRDTGPVMMTMADTVPPRSASRIGLVDTFA